MLDSFYHAIGEAGGQVGWAEMTARAMIVFAYGMLLTRFSGWRAFGKWSAPDIIVAIVIGSNLSRAVTGPARLLPSLVATTALVLAYRLVTRLASRTPWLDWLVKGRAIALVRDGRIDEAAMHRCAISRRDLDEALREKGIARLDRVSLACLERNGQISVLLDG